MIKLKVNDQKRKDGEQNWDVRLKFCDKEVQEAKFSRQFHVRVRSWILRGITTLLIWTCIVQLVAVGEVWGPRLLKSWPSCSSPSNMHIVNHNVPFVQPKRQYPPKRVYKSNGYLLVSCNGGLNQMRAAICDMVAIARYLNATLIVPELDKTSFWQDPSDFQDIFDVDHFITTLRNEVRILQELPHRLKRRVERGMVFELPPISWSNFSYYHQQILPLLKRHRVVRFNRTDARLANNGLPLKIQKLRCKVNFSSLRFTPRIEELAKKVTRKLRQKGPYLALHLRYEMDMLSFTGCTRGCNEDEVNELTTMRYANPGWKEKVIDPDLKREEGLCPLTPEETASVLTALGIDRKFQIYIAAGEMYGGEKRLRSLTKAFPNLVKKEQLIEPSDLQFFRNHSSQMAALDYLVSLESDVFIPTYYGNMAKVVEGHRRYLGFKKTVLLDRGVLVGLIDQFTDGSLSWDAFSSYVQKAHTNRMGSARERVMILDKPKAEDYFYANPQECLASP